MAVTCVSQSDLFAFAKHGGKLQSLLELDYADLQRREKLKDELSIFLPTAHLAEITPTHRLAAINAICCALVYAYDRDYSVTERDEDLLCDAFDIVFDRSHVTKAKPMRQLLTLLVNALRPCDPDQDTCDDEATDIETKTAVKERVLRTVFAILSHRSEQIKVKAALQVITALLNKNAVDVGLLSACHGDYFNINTAEEFGPKALEERIKPLLMTVLRWTRNRDTTHVVSNSVQLIVKRWKELLEKTYRRHYTPKLPVWADAVVESITSRPDDLSDFKNHIFPGLFKISPPDIIAFLQYLGLCELFGTKNKKYGLILKEINDTTQDLLYASLQVAKEIGVIMETDNPNIEHYKLSYYLMLRDTAVTNLLDHVSASIRLAGLTLIITTDSIKRPLTKNSLAGLKRNLFHLFVETDGHIRGEILGLMPRFLDRIRAATASLSKEAARAYADEWSYNGRHLKESLRLHQEFMQWLLRFLSAGLRPATPYQRHISCLKTLLLLAKSGIDPEIPPRYWSKQALGEISWPFDLTVFTPWTQRSLLDLVMDAFDDVRSIAVTLLEMSPLSTSPPRIDIAPNTQPGMMFDLAQPNLVDFIDRAETLMFSSRRADHADGVSRTYALLFVKRGIENGEDLHANSRIWWNSELGICQRLVTSLEGTLEIGERDLTVAVQRFPLHGSLASMRYIIDSEDYYQSCQEGDWRQRQLWNTFHSSLVASLSRVWHCVRSVLCNDAPEGHVPEELHPESDVDTNNILSYAWRALKEASSLMRTIVTRAPIVTNLEINSESIGLKHDDLFALARLSFTELAELRHRGAFSAVAQAFAACCSRAAKADRRDILDMLYADTLTCIRLQGSKITRRSAGIPSMIVGILSAGAAEALFHTAMADLRDEAEAPPPPDVAFGDPLPQVHALNCLRAIFANTLLSAASEPYITKTLSLAATCLSSDIWAIRNCGLMLFRSLIDRLLGTTNLQNWSDSVACRTSGFSFTHAPELLDIIVQLLQPTTRSMDLSLSSFESVFPALKLIQRIPLPIERRSEVREIVLRLCGSSHWHVRELAAKTYLTLLDTDDIAEAVVQLLPGLNLPHNAIHGRLLCSRYLTESLSSRHGFSYDAWSKMITAVVSAHNHLYQRNPCPITQAAYVDVLNALLIRMQTNQPLYQQIDDLAVNCSFRSGISSTLLRSKANHVLIRDLLNGLQENNDSGGQGESVIEGLAETAPNVCTMMLQDLAQALELQPALARSSYLPAALLRVGAATGDQELVTAAYNLLARILETQKVDLREFRDLSLLHLDRFTSVDRTPSPGAAAAMVRVSGALIDELCTPKEFTEGVSRALQQLLFRIRGMIDEYSPFDQRYAAVSCIDSFRNIWQNAQLIDRCQPMYTQALLLVYDSLTDDDEEIRALATSTANRILTARTGVDAPPAVPLVSSHKISSMLVSLMDKSEMVAVEAVQRLTRSTLREESLTPSAVERLQAAQRIGTALFAVEKQNLFVDEAREAVVWARVLKFAPTKSITRALASALSTWVMESLESLASVAATEEDGPLGWTSKQHMFVFGIQVLLGAGVLLHWRSVGLKMSVSSSSLRLSMWKLAETGRKNGMHDMWLELIDRTLQRSVIRTMCRGGKVLELVERKLAA